MTAALGAALRESGLAFRPGVSWTIDTPYRETVAEARHYQAEGVLCVEMEAAALFAVAEVRGLRLASAFVISDSLADLVWEPRFRDPAVRDGLIGLYQAAVAALMTGRSRRAGQAPYRRGGGAGAGARTRSFGINVAAGLLVQRE